MHIVKVRQIRAWSVTYEAVWIDSSLILRRLTVNDVASLQACN